MPAHALIQGCGGCGCGLQLRAAEKVEEARARQLGEIRVVLERRERELAAEMQRRVAEGTAELRAQFERDRKQHSDAAERWRGAHEATAAREAEAQRQLRDARARLADGEVREKEVGKLRGELVALRKWSEEMQAYRVRVDKERGEMAAHVRQVEAERESLRGEVERLRAAVRRMEAERESLKPVWR